MMRILKNIIFNKAEMATSINIRSLPEKATTLTTSTEITKIIEKIPDINDTDIANTNDINIIFENIENTPFKNITVESTPIRRSIRHRKAIFKIIGINIITVNIITVNIIEISETPTISADEKESEKKNYPPKIIIAKIIITNENKPTYEKAIVNSEESQ
jgi:hypothetical protein